MTVCTIPFILQNINCYLLPVSVLYLEDWRTFGIFKSCQAINFFNRALITVLMHISVVTFFSLFVFHLQVDVVGPLLLNESASILTTY